MYIGNYAMNQWEVQDYLKVQDKFKEQDRMWSALINLKKRQDTIDKSKSTTKNITDKQ